MLDLVRDSCENTLVLLVENHGIRDEYDLWPINAHVVKSIYQEKGLVDGGALEQLREQPRIHIPRKNSTARE